MLVSEIRQAGAEDIDFLIEAIIEAEKSGSEMISYCGIFGLSQAELIELMRKMLAEDLEGQQLCISGFAIACVDGEAVATCCSWIEGTYGISSSIITGSLLGEYLPAANFKEGLSKNEIMKGIHIERTKGCLQIESVYTLAAFRGKGLIRKLIQHHALQAQAPAVEIILAQTKLFLNFCTHKHWNYTSNILS